MGLGTGPYLNAQSEQLISMNSRNSDESDLYSLEDGQTRHKEIKSLRRAQAPRFIQTLLPDHRKQENIILFTFSDESLQRLPGFSSSLRGADDPRDLRSKSVGLAFAHENWSAIHPLSLTVNTFTDGSSVRIFFLYYTLPREIQEQMDKSGKALEYRFIVDGIWMADPENPQVSKKSNGTPVSLISLDKAIKLPVLSPELVNNDASASWQTSSSSQEMMNRALASQNKTKTVYLRYIGEANQEVYLQGTFNNFEPYFSKLSIKEPYWREQGKYVYEIRLRLLPGQYFYEFYIDGQTSLDTLNLQKGSSPEGKLYSILSVP